MNRNFPLWALAEDSMFLKKCFNLNPRSADQHLRRTNVGSTLCTEHYFQVQISYLLECLSCGWIWPFFSHTEISCWFTTIPWSCLTFECILNSKLRDSKNTKKRTRSRPTCNSETTGNLAKIDTLFQTEIMNQCKRTYVLAIMLV